MHFFQNYCAKFLFTLLLILTSLYYNTYCQNIKWKRIEGKRLLIPPDGIWLKDNLFIDSTEVANFHWREYMYFMAKADSLSDLSPTKMQLDWSFLPDSILYIHYGFYSYKKEIPNFYSKNTRLFYPVVGISYEQAQAYCKWRSKFVTNAYNQRLKKSGKSLRVLFNFRLPTEQEWELAAKKAHLSNSSRFFSKKEERRLNKIMQQNNLDKLEWQKINRPMFVCKYPIIHPESNMPIILEGVNILNDTREGESNKLGILNLFGNVAEMLSTKGIAKGGSWVHKADDCHVSKRQAYNTPSVWLGFRNVCEVHVYHKDNFPRDW